MKKYEWQEAALTAWREKGRRGFIIAPTGTGKTHLFLKVAREYDQAYYITPYNTIIEDVKARAHQAGIKNITYMTYAAASMRQPWVNNKQTTLNGEPAKTLVILDECHHAGAPTWRRILRTLNDVDVIGGTATAEGIPHEIPVVYTMDLYELRSIIPPVHAIVTPIYPTPDQEREYNYLREEKERACKALGWLLNKKNDDMDADELEKRIRGLKIKIMHLTSQMRAISMYNPEKIRAALNYMRQHKKTITFVETIQQALMLEKIAREDGLDAIAVYHGREEGIEAVRRHQHTIAVRMLDEGVNIPEIDALIFMTTPIRMRRAVQEVGRGLRGNKELYVYVIAVFDECASVMQYLANIATTYHTDRIR